MSIKLNISPVLSYYTDNQKSFEVKGNTVSECLDSLASQFPDLKSVIDFPNGRPASFIHIYINKEDRIIDDVFKPVEDGDEIDVEFLMEA